jgi:hypothetical protein
MLVTYLAKYDAMWELPSKDASGSMPLGNGDVAAMCGSKRRDLLLLLAKSDVWDENASLLKLGLVRVKLSPNPFLRGAPSSNTSGCMAVRSRFWWVRIPSFASGRTRINPSFTC